MSEQHRGHAGSGPQLGIRQIRFFKPAKFCRFRCGQSRAARQLKRRLGKFVAMTLCRGGISLRDRNDLNVGGTAAYRIKA